VNTAIAFVLVRVTSPKKEAVQLDSKQEVDSTKNEVENSTNVGATTGEKPIDVLVNIAGTDGERFLKVAIAFEYDNVKYPALAEALTVRAPKIKDILINYLSKLTLIEVTDPDAKDKIRKELLRMVNNSLPPEEGMVRDVYIVNYIIQ
jgi:flagellar basal body-associated protein FliL